MACMEAHHSGWPVWPVVLVTMPFPAPLSSLSLLVGEKGIGRSGKPLHYKGSKFHRVIPEFVLQVLVRSVLWR